MSVHSSYDQAAHIETGTQCHEIKEALSVTADRFRSAFVNIDLTGDKEEVISHTVQRDTHDDHPPEVASGSGGLAEAAQTQHPAEHAQKQDFLDAQFLEHDRHDQEETDLDPLTDGHGHGDLLDTAFAQIQTGLIEIESDGDTGQE